MPCRRMPLSACTRRSPPRAPSIPAAAGSTCVSSPGRHTAATAERLTSRHSPKSRSTPNPSGSFARCATWSVRRCTACATSSSRRHTRTPGSPRSSPRGCSRGSGSPTPSTRSWMSPAARHLRRAPVPARRVLTERRERRGPIRRSLIANITGTQIVAEHVTTGLVDEWITQAPTGGWPRCPPRWPDHQTGGGDQATPHPLPHRGGGAAAPALGPRPAHHPSRPPRPPGRSARSIAGDERTFFERHVFGDQSGRAEAGRIARWSPRSPASVPVSHPPWNRGSCRDTAQCEDRTRQRARPAHRRDRLRRPGRARAAALRPSATRISVLVRGKGSSAGAGPAAQLLRKPVFKAWRDAVGDDGPRARRRSASGSSTAAWARSPSCRTTSTSSSTPRRPSRSTRPSTRRSTPTSTAPIGLYEALLASGGDPHVVHVSTCYVGGLRKGVAPEACLDPRRRLARRVRRRRSARERVELLSREPERLREFMDAARERARQGGPAGGRPARARPPASSGCARSSSTTAAPAPRASAGPTSTRSPRRSPSAPPRSSGARPGTGCRSCAPRSSRARCSIRSRAGSTASRSPTR